MVAKRRWGFNELFLFYSCFCSRFFQQNLTPLHGIHHNSAPRLQLELPPTSSPCQLYQPEAVVMKRWVFDCYNYFSCSQLLLIFLIEKVKVTQHSCHQPHSVPWLKLKRSHTSSPYQHWLLLRGRKFSICPSLLHCFQASHDFFKWKVSRPPCHQLQLSLCTELDLRPTSFQGQWKLSVHLSNSFFSHGVFQLNS